MDNKLFFTEVGRLKSLKEQTQEVNSFSNRRKLRKQRKVVIKMIERAAKEQANIAYNQAYDLYLNFLTSNL